MTAAIKPFQPKPGGTLLVANAIAASAATSLDQSADQVVLTNTSATAIAFWRCDIVPDASVTPAAVTVATGFPVAPATQVRLTVGEGLKKFTVIASAADGNLYITPGRGN